MRCLHRSCLMLLVLMVVLGSMVPAQTAFGQTSLTQLPLQTSAVDRALGWLLAQQQADGSFGGEVGLTLDIVLAGASAGADVAAWSSAAGNPSALQYLATNANSYANSAAKAGKLAMTVVAAGGDPNAFGGIDLVSRVLSYTTPTGAMGAGASDQSWAMLGLVAARQAPPAGAMGVLKTWQQADGGWEGAPGWGTDSNTTSVALQALVAAGVPLTDTAMTRGTSYLSAQQSDTGGFTYSTLWGAVADANSTAYALQALVAIGTNPLGPAWLKEGASALGDLSSFQLPGGAFEWQHGQGANLSATAQAIPALLGRPFPFAGLVPAVRAAVAFLRGAQLADGSFPGTWDNNFLTLIALAAAHQIPRGWRGSGGASLIDYLASQTPRLRDTGQLGGLIAALAMARENPYVFGNINVIAALRSKYDPATGRYDAYSKTWSHVLALWALVACGEDVPPAAVAWLRGQQNGDGGWGWAAGQPSDSNSTAVAIQGLVGCGVPHTDPAIIAALNYLHSQQVGDGGFAWDVASFGSISDANSTAYAIQGILAGGAEPGAGWDWARALTETSQITITVHKPVDRLLAFQMNSGAFEYQTGAGANLLATVQAIPALGGLTFPQRSPTIAAAKSAVRWIKSQQRPDGSFAGSEGQTVDALMAGVAVGEDVSTWTTITSTLSPLDYLAGVVDAWGTNAANVGKLLTAVVAAGRNPTRFGGRDLVAKLVSFDPGTGVFSPSATEQAWAIIGLAAARCSIRQASVDALVAAQQSDGGWESGVGWGTDSNATALALQALRAAGVPRDAQAVTKALSYLKTQQSAAGGFAYSTVWDVTADANSTAYAIQGLLAAGEAPDGIPWTVQGATPTQALLTFQKSSGAFEWQPGSGENLLATAQAVPALLWSSNPLRTAYAHAVWLPNLAR